MASSPQRLRLEHAQEEEVSPIAAELATKIYLSTLKYAELVPLATTEAKNEQDRLQAILAITDSADDASKKKKAITALLTSWGYKQAKPNSSADASTPEVKYIDSLVSPTPPDALYLVGRETRRD